MGCGTRAPSVGERGLCDVAPTRHFLENSKGPSGIALSLQSMPHGFL